MDIKIETNIPEIRAKIEEIARRKLPWAMRQTVNDLAFGIRDEIYNDMRRQFENPTPNFTLRSTVVNKATTTSDGAWVGIRKDGGFRRSLAHELSGGNRQWKLFEGRLLRLGLVPAGYAVVTGNSAPMDAYGNLQISVIRKILAQDWRGAIKSKGYSTSSKTVKKIAGAKATYFVVPVGNPQGLQPGIYQRFSFAAGSAVKPILVFVKRGQYKKLIDIQKAAETILNRDAATLMAKNLARGVALKLGDSE